MRKLGTERLSNLPNVRGVLVREGGFGPRVHTYNYCIWCQI